MCKAISQRQSTQKGSTKKKGRRCVTFAKGCSEMEVRVSVRVFQLTSVSDQEKLHYTKKEKRCMRESARDTADDIFAQDNAIHHTDSTILGGFRCSSISNSAPPSNDNKFAYSSIIFRAFESCHANAQDLTGKELQLLIHWVSSGHSRRGLERSSVRGLKIAMQKLRRKALQEVVETHATAIANHGYLSKASEQSMAKVYRKYSAPSKNFAALMAKVDQAALCLKENTAITSTTGTPTATSTKSALTADPLLSCHGQELVDRLLFASSAAA